MLAKYLMSLDLGGSGGRAMLFNLETGSITTSTCAWSFDPDPGAGSFAFDLGCANKWQALCQIGRDVLARTGAGQTDVAGISVTSMRHGMVIIDKDGRVLVATPNKDARAFAESMDLQESRGDEFYQRTGHFPSPVILASRLVWAKNNRHGILESAAVVLTISDWMAYQLCGIAASEPSQAGETCLFDLRQGNWATDIIQSLGLPLSIFPKIVSPGTRLGGLSDSAAQELGLEAGIPVAAGGADTQLGLLGLGITAPNQVGVIAGSTTPVMVTTSQPCIDPQKHTWSGMHVIPGIYVVESNAGAMGVSLDWIASILYADSPAPVAALSGDAAKSIPGATGIFSTLGVQIFDATALGLPVDGLTFSAMTTPSGPPGRTHFSRAVLEGTAFSVRANTEQALELTQVKPDKIYIGGGMTRSALWTQIVADVFNLPLTVGCGQSTTGFGAVICAAVAAGIYPDLASATSNLVKNTHLVEPSAASEAYAELYPSWSNFRQQRKAADEIAQGIIMQNMQASMGGDISVEPKFRPRIYISANAGEDTIRILKELGDVTYASYSDQGVVLSGDELAQTIGGYQVLVTEVDLVDANVLQKAKDLRVVVACRGNPVNVDIPACTAAGVPVINTPGRNSDAVADLTISFMLMLARKLDKASTFLKEPGGEAGDMGRMGAAYFSFKGSELWHKTVGLIGGGAIGKKVTRRLLPFGARVLIYDPYLTAEEIALAGATKVSFEDLLEQSDFVSLHATVTEETTGMFNATAFDRMKPGSFLINTARAALVDYDALVNALRIGKLGGAAFDVFPVEPPGSDDPLLAFDNVITTPHIGGNTDEVGIHQGAVIVHELKSLLSGEKPNYILNPETLEGFHWTKERVANVEVLAELTKGPGPGVSDLDVKARKEEAQAINAGNETATKPKPGGLLNGLRHLIGGKEKGTTMESALVPQDAAPVAPNFGAEKFSQIIQKFLGDLTQDSAAQAFAQKNKVSFQFKIKGLGITFYMGYGDGKVNAGMGEPPYKPDAIVTMDAPTFDGMFTGRLDGRKAFSEGKISLSGNMLKAMAMQKLDFGAVYARARDAFGGLGNLASPAGPSVQTSKPATPMAVAPTTPPAAITQSALTPSFEIFNRIIERFLSQMATDADTQAFAKGKNVTFLFTIKDAGTNFYMSFVNGKVSTGQDEPPMKPDVTIKTNAETIDGMFTGRLDGAAAFKTGKLSVGGNMLKATAMQKLNFGKLYNQVRAQIGDPGFQVAAEAVKVPAAAPISTQAAAPTAPAPAAEGISVPTIIHKVGDIRDEILEINNEMFAKGWITSTGGNISARSANNPEEIWITPGSVFKGNLRPDIMVKVNLEGDNIGEYQYNASSERRVHCAIYRLRPEIKAVIHTHALYSTLMALTGTAWLPISADAAFFGQIPVVPFIMPGTPELGDEVAKAMGSKGVAAIMQNHGLVVAGSDLRRAADTTEAIEITAEKLLYCRKLGIAPATIPEDIVSILSELGSMVA
jgi:sugar (pentulose or hexulose) kinase/phosphoglycerate dehydrogenase-like enzyme/ribulose-5-phosphate 4-epimerase/fuculose-1-phosphate aldolase/putative sterol carrier protein